jgi:nitroreductase
MEFMEVVRSRHSVRTYQDKVVENEKLERILECGRLAPSARNSQCWDFVVVKEKETVERIGEACGMLNPWLKKVPTVLVACADPSESISRNGMDYYLVDLAIALEHIVLAATDLGLGTCWIAGYDEETVKEVLGVPKGIRVVALTPLGYPAEKEGIGGSMIRVFARSGKRKPMQELVHQERW